MSGSLGRVAVALLRWGRGAGGGGLWGPGVRAAGSGGGGGGSAEQLDALVKKDKVVVFLKGTPEQPQCGFSNAVVQILRLHGVRDYAAYNVLDDPQLRQGCSHEVSCKKGSHGIMPFVYTDVTGVKRPDVLRTHVSCDLMGVLTSLFPRRTSGGGDVTCPRQS
ncbi:glutaredoxin-related protein 5, mitochondrial isoform X1 [Felis catus]|uniref:glutaredoxin-related protein 5, mitochondrial isoform X1 n=2 Tax=Felis catus TaxID=9685 RepID=UPI001D1A26CE|nr:glutaredoxin-related protein 5, mitochondrial isoform X1 [Felis catus]